MTGEHDCCVDAHTGSSLLGTWHLHVGAPYWCSKCASPAQLLNFEVTGWSKATCSTLSSAAQGSVSVAQSPFQHVHGIMQQLSSLLELWKLFLGMAMASCPDYADPEPATGGKHGPYTSDWLAPRLYHQPCCLLLSNVQQPCLVPPPSSLGLDRTLKCIHM